MKKLTLLALLALTACSKTAAPEGPLDAGARRICMDNIESRAINKNSISYQDDPAAPVTKGANGQLEMTLKFSAKNEQGMASSLVARCVVSADGKKLVDIAVKEGR
ncbi:hypothetical protein [Massilia sp. CF038]|uniref:hypothetical protein n=1 Tax=Massilia sp. CF038 TaxID=1881045 RepID=UPI00091ACFB0|nr:hypothetical protein [Massilia sp. CF038]SHH19275.1 hypothetical protein SAMN05428948_3244 [Massilia sp. CF038]